MNVTNALQSGMIGLNRTLDNTAKAAGDLQGSGKPERAEEASGRAPQAVTAVQGTTVEASNEAAATQVVTAASETLGGNIDIHV